MIVIGYQGIGKSTLARKSFRHIDLESSALRMHGVRWHNWYEPYCMIAEWLSRQGYIVFVSSHKEVRDYLNEFCEEPFCAVVPSESLKDEWIDKLKRRYEQFPTDKNHRAYMNAVDRFTENIREIKEDVEDIREIKSMVYELDKMIAKTDTPQTETDFWASVTRDDWLKAHGLDADTPQTDIHGLTDCDFCKGKNCEDCEGGKDEPQTDCGWGKPDE